MQPNASSSPIYRPRWPARRWRRAAPLAVPLCVLGALARPARAAPAAAPEVALHAGAYAPIFFVYERPGVALSGDAAWPIAGALAADVSATLAALTAPGLRRGAAVVTGGVRYRASDRLWLRLGVGAAGYRERIGIDLASRAASATDWGAALVASTALGVELGRRWQLQARFDTNLMATRGMDYVGTAMVLAGRQL
jgi:hypothetical protein